MCVLGMSAACEIIDVTHQAIAPVTKLAAATPNETKIKVGLEKPAIGFFHWLEPMRAIITTKTFVVKRYQ